jgi:hypothetical protein
MTVKISFRPWGLEGREDWAMFVALPGSLSLNLGLRQGYQSACSILRKQYWKLRHTLFGCALSTPECVSPACPQSHKFNQFDGASSVSNPQFETNHSWRHMFSVADAKASSSPKSGTPRQGVPGVARHSHSELHPVELLCTESRYEREDG